MQQIAGIIYTAANSQEKILDLLRNGAEYHRADGHMILALHNAHFRCTSSKFERAKGLLVYRGWKEAGNGQEGGKKHLQLMGGRVAKPAHQMGPKKHKGSAFFHFIFNRFRRREVKR